jgi:hypothetical protein
MVSAPQFYSEYMGQDILDFLVFAPEKAVYLGLV